VSELSEFAQLFDFKGEPLVSALRMFLEALKLPGEAQKIDRITEVRRV
jgi:brefeldin A-resistance guanine nucleotide exchange factor 1